MRFIDEATIRVLAGHGGPGSVSFRREAHVPRGGPDGGDGGNGGDVLFKTNPQLGTLQDFRYKREFKAEAGHHGSGGNKTGKSGKDIVIEVPVGTVIRDSGTEAILVDLNEPDQEWVAARGGKGGRGNAHFVTSTHQAPKFAQPGTPGEERAIRLELKLLADVGIIGYPNAGKSTLISRISAAHPKIADYPFTTLVPNLGVVALDDTESCVVADIPGLIEGAHRGAGLGHKFLKHIERTRLFIHLIDGTRLLEAATRPDYDKALAGEDQDAASSGNPLTVESVIEEIIASYEAIRRELGLFDEALLHKPELVVLNKGDLFQSDRELIERAQTALRDRLTAVRGVHPRPNEPLIISAVSGHGIKQLLSAIKEILHESRAQTARRDDGHVPLPHELTDKKES